MTSGFEGYRGYQELKINLASAVVRPVENIFEGITENDGMYIIMQKFMNSSILSIKKLSGAKIISITSNKKSPLQKISDVVLASYGKESMVRSEAMESRITSLLLIDCLFVRVALKRLDVTLSNLEKIRAGIAVKRY